MDRQERLIQILAQSAHPMYSKQLCDLLDISPRTLRYDVTRINGSHKAKIQTSRNGYFLVQAKWDPSDADAMLQTKILVVLIHQRRVSVDTLADDFFVSNSRLQVLRNQMNERLMTFRLRIVRHHNDWIIDGSEANIRRLLANLIQQDIDLQGLDFERLSQRFFGFDLLAVKECLDQHVESLSGRTDFQLKNTLFNIAITLTCGAGQASVVSQDEFVAKLMKISGNQLGSSDQQFITQQIASLQEPSTTSASIEQLEAILAQTVALFCFKPMPQAEGLSQEIEALLATQSAYFVHNDFYAPIHDQHPLMFEAANSFAHKLHATTQIKLSDEMIGMVALHFSMAFQAPKWGMDGIDTLIICPEYQSLRTHILDQINRVFDNQLGPITMSNRIENQNSQLIIDVIGVPQQSANMVRVTPVADERDIAKIANAVSQLRERHETEALANMLKLKGHLELLSSRTIQSAVRSLLLADKTIQANTDIQAVNVYANRIAVIDLGISNQSGMWVGRCRRPLFVNQLEYANFVVIMSSTTTSRKTDLICLSQLIRLCQNDETFARLLNDDSISKMCDSIFQTVKFSLGRGYGLI